MQWARLFFLEDELPEDLVEDVLPECLREIGEKRIEHSLELISKLENGERVFNAEEISWLLDGLDTVLKDGWREDSLQELLDKQISESIRKRSMYQIEIPNDGIGLQLYSGCNLEEIEASIAIDLLKYNTALWYERLGVLTDLT